MATLARLHLLPLPLLLLAACGGAGGEVAPPASPPGSPPAPAPPVASAEPVSPAAPSADSGYDKPPQQILDVMLAPNPPRPNLSPTGDKLLLQSDDVYPPMSLVATPFLGLAGVRVEPGNRRKHDTAGGYGINLCVRDYTLVDVASSQTTKVALPSGCAEQLQWAADGRHFSFWNATADAVELWIGDAASGAVHRVEGVRLNPMLGTSTTQWMADQKTLLVKLVPDHQGPPPVAPLTPPGPSIQESDGKKGQSSTYELRDTLKNKHDEDLFDYYATTQLALVDIGSGAITRIGAPAIVADIDLAPDGEHLLVQSVHRPYSYVTTFDHFAHDEDVWDRSGRPLHRMASLPLADRVPIHGVPTGPRDFSWRQNEPATLVWSEALDGGDWNVKVPQRDKVLMQKAPFSTPPVELVRTEQRFLGFEWGERKDSTLLVEDDENRHWRKTSLLDVDQAQPKLRTLWDMSADEHYKAPGSPLDRVLPNGAHVMRMEGGSIFLKGEGSSPDGDRPFVDRFDLASAKGTRLFRSDKTSYERGLDFVDAQNHQLLTWRQSKTDAPNAVLHALGAPIPAAPSGEPTVTSTSRPVSHVADPTPVLRQIKKRLVKYKRKDGVDLSFTLFTPPGYQEGTRIPAILNAYPLDFAGASQAGQVTGTEQSFTRLYEYQLLLLAGYAVIDHAQFPIVGDPKKAYDTYLEQLTADAKAAVDKAIETGVVDPDRIGVTGHSHGALMTANLLAHTDLFRAGAATSGSYNKTLTPFGFQNERRSVWEAQPVYLKVSPFFFADKIKLPLLIVHGADDANPGTTPLQGEKLFEAVRGNGGTTRLVMLPHEPHWYTALESNEQLVSEMVRWFDRYVKNAPPRSSLKK